LVHVARLPHNPFCSIHHLQNHGDVYWLSLSDSPIHFCLIAKLQGKDTKNSIK
jgi:hypothetical protein